LDLVSSFADSMLANTAENFRSLCGGALLNRGRGWISRAVTFASYFGSSKHHSAWYRFFSRARWHPDAIGRRVFEHALQWVEGTVEVAVDDTLCKRTGPHVWGAGVHIDPLATIYKNSVRATGKKAFAFGHSWVVLSLRIQPSWLVGPGFAIPILSRLYRAKKSCQEDEYAKRTALAAQMVEQVRSWLPEGRHLSVVGDHEYACTAVIGALPSRTSFTGPLPKDARFFALPKVPRKRRVGRPRKRGKALPSPQQIDRSSQMKWRRIRVRIYSRSVWLEVVEQRGLWYSVDKERVCRMIVTRDPRGRYATRAIVTTDLRASVSRIIERYSRRWLIEVMFRQAKQHLGLGRAQNGWEKGTGSRMERRARREKDLGRGHRGRLAVERTVPFTFILYAAAVLHGLRITRRSPPGPVRLLRPWARADRQATFEDLLSACRVELATQAISADPANRRVRKNSSVPLATALAAA
jgi:hypothetical protein